MPEFAVATLYKVSCLGLAPANQNAAVRFYIPLHCVAAYNGATALRLSHAPAQPRNRSNVTRPFPARGFGSGNEPGAVQRYQLLVYYQTNQLHGRCTRALRTINRSIRLEARETNLLDQLCLAGD